MDPEAANDTKDAIFLIKENVSVLKLTIDGAAVYRRMNVGLFYWVGHFYRGDQAQEVLRSERSMNR